MDETKIDPSLAAIRYNESSGKDGNGVAYPSIMNTSRTEVYDKPVPMYDYDYRDKVIEVPQFETVNTEVEVEKVEEIVKRVAVKQRIEVPKEVVKYVTKVITKVVEKEVEVAGDVVQIPKPFKIENKVIVPRYINREVPTVVSQIIEPIVRESESDVTEIVLQEYEPYLIPVDVYLPRPVSRDLVFERALERHTVVDVPPSHFNALVKAANLGATDRDVDGLLVKQLDGSIPMLNLSDDKVINPVDDDWKASHKKSTKLHIASTPGQPFRYPNLSDAVIMSS